MPGVQTSQTVLYCKMLAVKLNITFYTTDQPSKFLLGHHLASKSFGLGRLYCKSSRQLQNSTHHGDQNGCNLEWLKTAFFAIVTKKMYLAVVLRTYSSMLSISGLMVEIIVAKPAA